MYLFLFFLEFILLFLLSNFLTQSLAKLFYKVTRSEKLTVYLFFLLFFPGIIIHELSHLFMAGLLFVRTGEMVLFPKIIDDGVRLGSVEVEKTDPFRRAIIGVAPVLFGLALIFGILFYLQALNITNLMLYTFFFYVVFAVGNTLFSSRKDLEGTIELLVTIALILCALFILNATFWHAFLVFLQKKELANFFKSADMFLIAPVLIDLIIVSIIGVFIRKRS